MYATILLDGLISFLVAPYVEVTLLVMVPVDTPVNIAGIRMSDDRYKSIATEIKGKKIAATIDLALRLCVIMRTV